MRIAEAGYLKLLDPPDQETVFRRMASPAEQGPLPAEVQLGSFDPVVVPVAIEGHVQRLIFPRQSAAEYVLAEREIVLRATRADQRLEWERCRRSRLWFIARWLDVESKFRLGPERTVPFLPFPYQVRLLGSYELAIATRRGLFHDKSRQLGISWEVMAWFLHGLLFEDQTSFFATSRKQDEVDDGGSGSTTKSLFGRLRFMFERLPPFLRCVPHTTIDALTFRHLAAAHRTNGSYIVGEASTPNIARGNSYTRGLLDEFAHVDQSESGWASADEAIECPIVNSTPVGEDNKFADFHHRLSHPKSDRDRELRKRFVAARTHWSEHPVYARGIAIDADGRLTSPWYRTAVASKLPEKAAQEYDISYTGSTPGRFFPEFSRGVHVPEADIPLRRECYLYLSADHGLSDTEVWGLWQTDGETFAELVDEWHSVPPGAKQGLDQTSAEVAEGIVGWLNEWGLALRFLAGVIPDPSGGARDQTSGQSHHDLLFAVWRRMHQVVPEWIPGHNAFAEGIESTRLLFRGTWRGRPFRVRVSPRCTLVIDSLQSYRRRITRDGRVLDQEVHDWSSHAAAMVRYFAHTLFPAIGDEYAEAAEPESYVATSGRI